MGKIVLKHYVYSFLQFRLVCIVDQLITFYFSWSYKFCVDSYVVWHGANTSLLPAR